MSDRVAPGDDTQERIVPLRLQKFLARAGVASRRGSEDLMTAGRVTVNGLVVTELGSRVDPMADEVAVDGEIVTLDGAPVYAVLNKPAGYVTTMLDPQGRPTVAELIEHLGPAVFPVGRLDLDTTGVLLVTSDGPLAYRLMHPSFHVTKTYEAVVKGALQDSDLQPLRVGMELDDGPTKPASARVLDCVGLRTRVELELSEGRKRQVKRMFMAIGHPVLQLHRAAFGPVVLGDLAEGRTRPLSEQEITALRQASHAGEDGAQWA